MKRTASPAYIVCAAAAFAIALAGCGGTTAMQRCPGTDPSSRDECLVSDDPGVAVGHAAAAAAVAVVGGGCSINGCLPPLRCDSASGLCKPLPCGEGKSCPDGYQCDSSTQTCH